MTEIQELFCIFSLSKSMNSSSAPYLNILALFTSISNPLPPIFISYLYSLYTNSISSIPLQFISHFHSTASHLFPILLHGSWCPCSFWTSLSVYTPLACVSPWILVKLHFSSISFQIFLIWGKLSKLLRVTKPVSFPVSLPNFCHCLFSQMIVSAYLTS